MAAGTADQRRPVDPGLAVIDAADRLAPGPEDRSAGRLQSLGVRHLQPDVVVAAPAGLDQDQLVVALVAGEVSDPPPALTLDQAENLSLEGDGGVKILDAHAHVPDPGNATDRLILGRGRRWS